MSPESELFYRRLMSVVDDYGRYFAHPSLLRAACYPLQLEKISESDVQRMLNECVATAVLVLYRAGKYLQVVKFRQQTRSKSKFPEPSESEMLINCTSNVKQMRSESESESESKARGHLNQSSVLASDGPDDAWIKNWVQQKLGLGADYRLEEALFAASYFRTNGWKLGTNAVVDWGYALERQIGSDRKRDMKPKAGRFDGNPIRAGGGNL